MFLTVITVCLNAKECIKKTIESVLCQTSGDFEYIIKDGDSSDGTIDMVRIYQEQFEKRQISFSVINCSDKGIYDAMNQAVAKANGEYIYFLNAGDIFHQDDVLEKISAFSSKDRRTDIVYGDTLFVDKGFGELRKADHKGLEAGMSICHQGMFVKKDLLMLHPFKTSYKLCADYEFTLYIYKKGGTFTYTGITIADFLSDGVSTLKIREVLAEHNKIRNEYGIVTDIKKTEVFLKRAERKRSLKEKIPDFLWTLWCEKIRKRQAYIPYYERENEE